jgi:hypothetical protein
MATGIFTLIAFLLGQLFRESERTARPMRFRIWTMGLCLLATPILLWLILTVDMPIPWYQFHWALLSFIGAVQVGVFWYYLPRFIRLLIELRKARRSSCATRR